MYQSHDEWVKTEGDIEHPTHLKTLQKPEQVARIVWLKSHIGHAVEVLDMGCNYGYVLNQLVGYYPDRCCGVDINIENIDKAMKEYPLIHWMVGDVTKKWQFDDNSYAVVVLAEILEHIPLDKLKFVLSEAIRVARVKTLITIPYRPTDDCAFCFKHLWIPTDSSVGYVVMELASKKQTVTVESDGNFVYIEATKK